MVADEEQGQPARAAWFAWPPAGTPKRSRTVANALIENARVPAAQPVAVPAPDVDAEAARRGSTSIVVHRPPGVAPMPLRQSSAGEQLPKPPNLTPGCAGSMGYLAIYAVVIAAFTGVSLIGPLRPVGLALLAIAPSIMFVLFLVRRFREVIDLWQLTFTTLWAIGLMLPLVLLHLMLSAFGAWRPLYDVHDVMQPLLTAYVQAGLLEELLKFNAIRAVLWKDLVADPRALLVYACGAANGFALIENLLYVLNSGPVTGVLRAFLSVPAHTAWGMMSGTALAERKFLGTRNAWYTIVPLPVVAHGTYNFALFAIDLIPPEAPTYATPLLFLVAPLVTIASLVYVYRHATKFADVPLVEVRPLQKAGLLPRATLGSCGQDCLVCLPCFEADEDRNMSAETMVQIQRQFRAPQSPARRVVGQHLDASDAAPGHDSARSTGARAATPPSARAAQQGGTGRLLLVTVPADYVPGHRLKVVSPHDGREYFVDVPSGSMAPGSQLVVQY